MLGGAADVSCRSDKIPQAVVITILGGNYGDHAPIMVSARCGSTGRKRTRSLGRLRRPELALKSAECRDRQLGGIF